MQQGGVRYADEEDKVVPKGKTGHDEDEQFFFDPEIPAIQPFIHFKATVIGRKVQELKSNE